MTGAELARVTCAEQGVPFTVDDDRALDAVAALIAATSHHEGVVVVRRRPDKARGRPAGAASESTADGWSGGHSEHSRRVAHAARIAARLDGCRCDPDVVVTGVTVGGVRHVHIEHDAWCTLGGDES